MNNLHSIRPLLTDLQKSYAFYYAQYNDNVRFIDDKFEFAGRNEWKQEFISLPIFQWLIDNWIKAKCPEPRNVIYE